MNALIENRREQKEGDRRMIEANEKTQLMYAAEKREKIIIEQQQIISELQKNIADLNVRLEKNNHLKWGAVWVFALLTSLSFLGWLIA